MMMLSEGGYHAHFVACDAYGEGSLRTGGEGRPGE